MKADSNSRSERASAVDLAAAHLAAAQGAGAQALAESFRASLQRHRRATESPREEPKQKAPSSSTTRGETRSTRQRGGAAPDETRTDDALKDLTASQLDPTAASPRACRLAAIPDPATHSTPAHAHAAELASSEPRAASLRFRRATAANGPTITPCIEVTHARTGVRFLLSREHDVWLLTLDSSSQPLQQTELSTLSQLLTAEFAARGLGPIDVIQM